MFFTSIISIIFLFQECCSFAIHLNINKLLRGHLKSLSPVVICVYIGPYVLKITLFFYSHFFKLSYINLNLLDIHQYPIGCIKINIILIVHYFLFVFFLCLCNWHLDNNQAHNNIKVVKKEVQSTN